MFSSDVKGWFDETALSGGNELTLGMRQQAKLRRACSLLVKNVLHREIIQPLTPIPGVIALSGPVKSHKSNQTFYARVPAAKWKERAP